MEIFTLSAKEIDRLEIVQLVTSKRLSVTKAAERCGVSRTWMSQLVNAYRREGTIALASGRRGKPANNKLSSEMQKQVCAIIREHYSDFGPTLAAEYLAERHDITVSRETLRKWMVADGIWTTRAARRKRVQQRRQRRECRGELVQLDGSHHDWFEGRAPKCCLLVFIDDATSELLHLEFVPSESTFALMTATRHYVSRHGRPLALYTDKATVFRNASRSRSVSKSDADMSTQFTRGLDELGIALICANSPQAKGRVERANGVLQDRLIKAMRLDGISDMRAANSYAATYMTSHNARFARVPANSKELHRALNDHHDVTSAMCVKETRKVTNNLDLRYEGHLVILDPAVHEDGFDPYSLIHGRVDIHDYPDGRFEVLYQGRVLPYRIYNKSPRIQQSDVVSNKRLGAALTLIKAQQEAGETKSYTQRRRRTSHSTSPIAATPNQSRKTSLKVKSSS